MRHSRRVRDELVRKKKRQVARRNSLVTFSFVLLFGAVFIFFWGNSSEEVTISEDPKEEKAGIVETITSKIVSVPKKTSTDRLEIKNSIQEIIDATSGTYGYYIYEIDTGLSFGNNEDEQYVAASTNKVPILVQLYIDIEKDEVKKDDVWTYLEHDYEMGTGSIQYKEVGTKYTVEELAEKMIKESDNVATNIIVRNLNRGDVQDMVDGQGLSDIDMYKNLATPKAMSEMLLTIYRYELTSKSSSEEMLTLMTDTLFEKRLPRYLPEGAKVSHKIGTQSGAISDVGIVFLEDKPFVISVYSKNVQDVDEAEKTIGRICEKVYEFEKTR